ncbi:YbfB/YjiJ family MFS transporter [Piscinibacter defluvii]|uniref:YbfB/YjiJ family MFS transporter n=1 Tax=Piscinibacter defluvii TaxID=1796922 RepID=UPI000FDF5645|nr:YbfB/YjiJ family MFS transporter [Piscinibacter defluvii]
MTIGPGRIALVGLLGLASAMGIGRFAFTPMLPLMQAAGQLSLPQASALAGANYLGYLAGALACTVWTPAPLRAARTGLAAVALLTLGMALTTLYPLWLALRFGAGVASAYVLVGVSAWAVPALAAAGHARRAGLVFAGVGTGIALAGLGGLGAGIAGWAPAPTWALLGAVAAAVALGVHLALPHLAGDAARAAASGRGLGPDGWRLVVCYGAFGFGYIIPATFLPALARQQVADPALFGWVWPAFGAAAALSTLLAARWAGRLAPRRLWALGQGVMALGLALAAGWPTLAGLLACAVCVGGTFMVMTMAAMQEARRSAGERAPRLMAAMTAAFAAGQLAGPFSVGLFGSDPARALALAQWAAAALLAGGAIILWPDLTRSPA